MSESITIYNLIDGQTNSRYSSSQKKNSIYRAWVYLSALKSSISYSGTLGESDMTVSASNVASVLVDFVCAILVDSIKHAKFPTEQLGPTGIEHLFTNEMRAMLMDASVVPSGQQIIFNDYPEGSWDIS